MGLLGADKFPCFPDQDYAELLEIAEHGLTHAARPASVVVVGAGIGGLTAAKLLRDAGHNVGTPVRAGGRWTGPRVSSSYAEDFPPWRREGPRWWEEVGAAV